MAVRGSLAVVCFALLASFGTPLHAQDQQDNQQQNQQTTAPSAVETINCATATACAVAGNAARLGVAPQVRNPGLAIALLRRACDLGSGDGCNDLAVMTFTGDGMQSDLPAAYQLFAQGCHLRSLMACFNQAQRLDRAEGVARNTGQAYSLMSYACGENYAPACYNLGHQAATAEVNVYSTTVARQYYDRACNNGLVRGCAGREILDRNEAMLLNRTFATLAENLEGCARGSLRACNDAAFTLANDTRSQQAFVQAAELFARACDGGNKISCYNLGTHHFSGLVWANRADGIAAYWKACLADDFISCEILADHYVSSGEGRFEPDYVWAGKVWTYLCARGRAPACAELGHWQLHGMGMPVDQAAARASFERACRLNSLWGCYRVAALQIRPGQDARAIRLLRRVCARGHARSCNEAGDIGLRRISSHTHRRRAVLPDFQRGLALDPLDAHARRQVSDLSGRQPAH